MSTPTPTKYQPRELSVVTSAICDSQWLCLIRRNLVPGKTRPCDCGGTLHSIYSEKGIELKAKRDASIKAMGRFRTIDSDWDKRVNKREYKPDGEWPDYVPTHRIFQARHSTIY